jgi:hypothetical protein
MLVRLRHRYRRLGVFCLFPVDALEQHRELDPHQMNVAAISLWPDEAVAFEPLGQQTQAVARGP